MSLFLFVFLVIKNEKNKRIEPTFASYESVKKGSTSTKSSGWRYAEDSNQPIRKGFGKYFALNFIFSYSSIYSVCLNDFLSDQETKSMLFREFSQEADVTGRR